MNTEHHFEFRFRTFLISRLASFSFHRLSKSQLFFSSLRLRWRLMNFTPSASREREKKAAKCFVANTSIPDAYIFRQTYFIRSKLAVWFFWEYFLRPFCAWCASCNFICVTQLCVECGLKRFNLFNLIAWNMEIHVDFFSFSVLLSRIETATLTPYKWNRRKHWAKCAFPFPPKKRKINNFNFSLEHDSSSHCDLCCSNRFCSVRKICLVTNIF